MVDGKLATIQIFPTNTITIHHFVYDRELDSTDVCVRAILHVCLCALYTFSFVHKRTLFKKKIDRRKNLCTKHTAFTRNFHVNISLLSGLRDYNIT